MDLPPLVSVQEAADCLGITRQGVLKATKGKVLPATRVAGTPDHIGPPVSAETRLSESGSQRTLRDCGVALNYRVQDAFAE